MPRPGIAGLWGKWLITILRNFSKSFLILASTCYCLFPFFFGIVCLFISSILSPSLWHVFSFSSHCLLKNRCFKFWWNPVYWFVLLQILVNLLRVPYLRSLCLTQRLLMFSSGSFIVLGFTFKSMIHMELLF